MEKEKMIVISVIVVFALIFVSVLFLIIFKSPAERGQHQTPATQPENNSKSSEEQKPNVPPAEITGEKETTPEERSKILNSFCDKYKEEGKELPDYCEI